MLPEISGLDHLVVLVRDLEASAALWRGLGFTVSPRGEHSPHLKTANHTIMFGPNYLELLAVTGEAPTNARWRRTLAAREGLAGAALGLADADAAAAALGGLAVRRFGRPVRMPDGSTIEARFAVFDIADDAAPDLRLFACQHLVREATWAPGLSSHANTAQAIRRVELVDPDPRAAAGSLARLYGAMPEPIADGLRVPAGAAAFEVVTADAFRARHGVAPAAGPAAIVLRVADRDAAEQAVAGVPHRFVGEGIETSINGVLLRLEP
jgi:catechol 2,3-dioxygenase-like lactoylglutathione lyase family enzyme